MLRLKNEYCSECAGEIRLPTISVSTLAGIFYGREQAGCESSKFGITQAFGRVKNFVVSNFG